MESKINGGTKEAPSKKVHADPTKDFFVNMITRDISLEGCIFDLLDNSIDGARRSPTPDGPRPLSEFSIDVTLAGDKFVITDNCGGIRLSDAIDYAFHFGRRSDNPTDVAGGIGLYGIGMKRALFKIGAVATVNSEAADGCFRVKVDVEEWKKKETDWDFDYDDVDPIGSKGTRIEITKLNTGISEAFTDPGFSNSLVKNIARDYAFFIRGGLRIRVGEDVVPSYRYELKSSADISPAVDSYEDDGVRVKIAAGLIDELMDDVPSELRPKDVERYGWFVICNNRIVLAANKSDLTVWGNDGYQVWHPQYNGFAGFVFFEADDQRKLPWTTTKRDLDASSPLYKRALARMKRATDGYIEYTNRRKLNLEEAKGIERDTQQVDVFSLKATQVAKLPKLSDASSLKKFTTISYQKSREDIDRIRNHIGRITMSAGNVGSYTFDYFKKMELGE